MTDHDEHDIWSEREADTRYTRRAGLVIALIVACAAIMGAGVLVDWAGKCEVEHG